MRKKTVVMADSVQRSKMWRPRVVGFCFPGGVGPSSLLRWRRSVRACTTEVPSSSSSSSGGSSSSSSSSSFQVSPESVTSTTATKETERRLRVLSGVQPTGVLHLGNYLGAVKQWVDAQDKYDNYFTVVDLHAITVSQNPKELRESSLTTTALYLACGIDPKKSNIFLQSHVTAHSELTWLLNCITPLGWMERMVQYKEKAQKQGENVSLGLLAYPVLMAADVLLYQADLVPVGEDQAQHLELARNIVGRFNFLFDKKGKRRVFKAPKTMVQTSVARVMSLEDGTKKMSKSDPSDNSRINLLDPPDVIRRKIKRCKTDSVQGLEFGNPERPECNNLLTIYEALSGVPHDDIVAQAAESNFGTFKRLITDALVETLAPIQARHAELMADKAYLHQVLREGAENAEEVANETLYQAQDALGYLTRRSIDLEN